jgi:hypothetical protein
MDRLKATHLNTDSLNLNDIILLQVVLNDKFYLRIRLIQKLTEQGEIVIPVRQIQSVNSIVGPYVVLRYGI